MVGNTNIPKDLVKIFEIKDTSDVLRRFLTDLHVRTENLEEAKTDLEARIEELENGN